MVWANRMPPDVFLAFVYLHQTFSLFERLTSPYTSHLVAVRRANLGIPNSQSPSLLEELGQVPATARRGVVCEQITRYSPPNFHGKVAIQHPLLTRRGQR